MMMILIITSYSDEPLHFCQGWIVD